MLTFEQIDADLIVALKAKESFLVSTLRLLKSALKNAEIAKTSELTEPEAISVLEKQAKQRRDSIEQFSNAGRNDLADKEKAELEIIQKYLPQKMSEEELSQVIDRVIAETGATGVSDLGRVMKEAIAKTAGAADGATISRIAKEKLS